MSKKTKIIVFSILGTLLLGFGGAIFYVSQKVNSKEIRLLTIEQLKKTFPSANVELGEFEVSFGTRLNLEADNLKLTYPTKKRNYNLITVKDIFVKIPLWSIITGGGNIDIELESPKVSYIEMAKGTNWSLSMEDKKGNKAKTKKPSKKENIKKAKGEVSKEEEGSNSLMIPAFMANSSINLRFKDINLDYSILPKTKGNISISKFLISNLGLKSKAAFELDSKIVLGEEKQKDVSFNALVIGEFSLNEFLMHNKISSNVVLKISDIFLKDSTLKIPMIRNNIVFNMEGESIFGSMNTDFEKSKIGLDFRVGGKEVRVSKIKADFKIEDLMTILNDSTLPISANNSDFILNGEIGIKNDLITPNLTYKTTGLIKLKHDLEDFGLAASGSIKGVKNNINVVLNAFSGKVDVNLASDFNLNSKKPVQDRLKRTKIEVNARDIVIKKELLQTLIYAPGKETTATASKNTNENIDEKSAKGSAKAGAGNSKKEMGTPFVIPNSDIIIDWDKIVIGSEKTKGNIKLNIKNNIIKTNKYKFNFGKGFVTGKETITLGKNSTSGSFNLALKNIQFDSFQAFLPPQVTNASGEFNGTIAGSFHSSKKVTYDVKTSLNAKNGELKGINVDEYVKKVYGLVEKISVLKGKLPKKEVKVDGNFEKLGLIGRFRESSYDLKKFNFVGINKKIDLSGSGTIYPPPSLKEGKVYVDFKDSLGLPKIMVKNVGTDTLPLLFKGKGYDLSPDYGYSTKKLAKKALKTKGKKQVNKAVNKLKKKLFKSSDGKDQKGLEDEIKNKAKKLFKGFL